MAATLPPWVVLMCSVCSRLSTGDHSPPCTTPARPGPRPPPSPMPTAEIATRPQGRPAAPCRWGPRQNLPAPRPPVSTTRQPRKDRQDARIRHQEHPGHRRQPGAPPATPEQADQLSEARASLRRSRSGSCDLTLTCSTR